MMEELKPCPDCGKTDMIQVKIKNLGCQPCYIVVCCRCSYHYAAFITKEEAIRSWNNNPERGDKK